MALAHSLTLDVCPPCTHQPTHPPIHSPTRAPIHPPTHAQMKFEAEIKAVQKRLQELEKLENSKQVLPLSEAMKLNAKPKLLEDLAAMQTESRGWFWEAATT